MLPRIDTLIDLALEEDAGLGDLTSRAIFPDSHRSRAVIEAGQDLVVCGLQVAQLRLQVNHVSLGGRDLSLFRLRFPLRLQPVDCRRDPVHRAVGEQRNGRIF